ncbi:hypothetical protein GOV11_02230 [Candidatus Woesearchaeota archaeon]|nr:hypothetical protein [Candidatus Woesearchaeota archaeon]
MEQEEITGKCIRCYKLVPILEMVVDASGKGMTCRPCAGLSPEEKKEPVPTKKKEPGKQLRYTCGDCKFAFSSVRQANDVTCGYCGSRNILTERESSAQAMLDDVAKRRFSDDE